MTNGVISLGTLTESGVTLDDKAGFRAACRRMGAGRGGRVRVSVERIGDKRSLDQNAYLHAEPFPALAEYFGDSVEGVKYDLMGEFWGWHQSPIDPSRMVPVKPSTSSMTVEECSKFIDWLIPWAAQKHGVIIRYPDEWKAA